MLHHDPMIMFLAWQQALPNKSSKKLWKMSFYAIIWFIWILRNDMVFNGKVFDFEQIIDTSKFRLASWFKAKWSDSHYTILDIVRFPKDIQVLKISKATKRAIVWESPPPDSIKFNMDGSARGKHWRRA